MEIQEARLAKDFIIAIIIAFCDFLSAHLPWKLSKSHEAWMSFTSWAISVSVRVCVSNNIILIMSLSLSLSMCMRMTIDISFDFTFHFFNNLGLFLNFVALLLNLPFLFDKLDFELIGYFLS